MKSAESTMFSPTRRRVAMALPLLGCVSWASAAPVSRAPQRESRALMGTQVDIVVDGGDEPLLRHAVDHAYAEMARLEALFSRYQPDSVVSRISAAAGVQPVAVPSEVMAVLKTSQQLFRLSGGAFDVTVGSLKGWSFEAGRKTVPPAGVLARQRQLVDARRLVLDEQAGTAYLARQGMALDLGGIAKLPILEAGMRVLRQQGVSNALINGGGDVLVMGQLQGRPWRVGLRDPRAQSACWVRCLLRARRWWHRRVTTSAISSWVASASTIFWIPARDTQPSVCMASVCWPVTWRR